jgi:hypothetical protein
MVVILELLVTSLLHIFAILFILPRFFSVPPSADSEDGIVSLS